MNIVERLKDSLDYEYNLSFSERKQLLEEIDRLNNIINELEMFMIDLQKLKGINQQGFSWGVCQECLDKLKELKENK